MYKWMDACMHVEWAGGKEIDTDIFKQKIARR